MPPQTAIILVMAIVVPVMSQMKCSYGERGSLTATCLNATPNYFRTTTYRFDSLDETVRCINCNLETIEANTFDISGNQIITLDLRSSNIINLRASSFVGLVFMKNLLLKDNKITSMFQGIFRGVQKLEELDLSQNSIKIISGYSFAELINLKKLDLSLNQIKTIDGNAFANLSLLEEVNLSNNFILEVEEGLFSYFTNIRSINLNNNSITDLHPMNVSISKLQAFDLSGNKLVNLKNNTFSFMHNLIELNLSINKIHNIEVNAFKGLIKLERLNLKSNNISEIARGCFVGLSEIRELSLAHNSIRAFRTSFFSAMPEIRFLDLSFNQIKIVLTLGVIPLSNLHTLDISNNQLTDIDYKAMFSRMPKVTYLNLENNPWPCYIVEEIDDYFKEDNIKLSQESVLSNVSCTNVVKEVNDNIVSKLVLEEELGGSSYAKASVVYTFLGFSLILNVAIILYLAYMFKSRGMGQVGNYGNASRVNLVTGDGGEY